MALEEELKATSTRWWATHKQTIHEWAQLRQFMMVHFGDSEIYHIGKYDGQSDPTSHLMECQALWASRPKDEWVHAFFHTLDEMPRSWYVAVVLRRTITTWEELSVCFAYTFSFQDANLEVHNAL